MLCRRDRVYTMAALFYLWSHPLRRWPYQLRLLIRVKRCRQTAAELVLAVASATVLDSHCSISSPLRVFVSRGPTVDRSVATEANRRR